MITPTKPANRISKDFVVCDIENRSDGSVISIQTFDGNAHIVHYDWSSWLADITCKAKVNRKFRTVYAHNGGGWDWLSFIEWVIAKNPDQRFRTIEDGGKKIIAVRVPVGHKCTLKLVDSLRLLGCSLEKASQTYLGIGKVENGGKLPEWLWENQRETYWSYALRDTENLHKILCKFSDMVFTKIAPIGKLGLTLPSTALRCFTTGYLDREVTIPEAQGVKDFLREGYVGGRVEVFKSGYFPRVKVYDFNSLYPSVMASTNVPTTGSVTHTTKCDIDRTGIFRVRFIQGDRSKLPLLLLGGLGAYAGAGVFFTNELRRLIRMAKGKIDVIEGFHFDNEAVLFKKYSETLYDLRKLDHNGPLGNTAKLLANSLYGKTAQRGGSNETGRFDVGEVTALINETDEKTGKPVYKVETVNEEQGIYSVSRTKSPNFEHVGIAGTITSESRARLWESFDSGTVYCDTDSIHTVNVADNDRVTSLDFGKLKLEYDGEAVYVGKKMYALRNKDTEKVRAKGIRVGGRNGFSLSFDSLRTLADGAIIPCTFKGASTASKVLRGKTACVFMEQTRRIRKTANV